MSTPLKSNLLLADSIIAVIIATTPIIFYSYECFPDVKIWETSFFTYTSIYYQSVSTFVWVFMQKFIFLYLMIIWFFTSKNWWNKSILVPIGMLLYQITILVNDEIHFKDVFLIDKFFILTITAVFLFFLIKIRNKLLFYINAIDLKDQIEIEISKIESE